MENRKISLKQKLLSTKEFNFSNKFLWKLPRIVNKFKSVSPVFKPEKFGMMPIRIKNFRSVSFVKDDMIEQPTKGKQRTPSLNEPNPFLLITGVSKMCEKQYFRKTHLAKLITPRQNLQKNNKKNYSEEYHIKGWGEGERSKALL